MMLISHGDKRIRRGRRSYYDVIKFFWIRRRAPKLVLRRFMEVFESNLVKLEVFPDAAIGYNIGREISHLRMALNAPMPTLHAAAHWIWEAKGWDEFVSPRPNLSSEAELGLYGRACVSKDCRSAGHRRCRFPLDSVTVLDDFRTLCSELQSRLDRLERAWEAWELDESSLAEVSALIEKDPKYREPRDGHRYLFDYGVDKVLIGGRLAVHINTALGSMKTAQRAIYRQTLKSGSLYDRLSRTKAPNQAPKGPQGRDFQVALVPRSVAHYAYLENNLWLLSPDNATSGDDLDMEVFLMLWSKSAEIMPLVKIASAARAMVRGENTVAIPHK